MKKNKKAYKSYLRSNKWKSKRGNRIFKDEGRCQAVVKGHKCGSKYKIEVHHLTYKRFGNELMSDLITLCHGCHQAVHAKAE